MLEKWTRGMLRKRVWIFAVWAVIAGVVFFFAPHIKDVIQSDQSSFLPGDAETGRAEAIYRKAFGSSGGHASLTLVFERRGQPLTPEDEAFVRQTEQWAGENRTLLDAQDIFSPFTEKALRDKMISEDGQAALLNITMHSATYTVPSEQAVAWLKNAVSAPEGVFAARPAGLEIYVSGDAAIAAEEHDNTNRSMDRTVVVTIVLLLVLLTLIYRSPFAPFLPLGIIGLAYFIARGVVAAMATQGLRISSFTDTFLVAVLFGAGTDYCLLMVSRFREELLQGHNAEDAVLRAVPGTGEAVLSSGGTVMIGFFFMILARFGLFNATGPSVAIGVGITLLAVMSLVPAVLRITGERIFWPFLPSRRRHQEDRFRSFWQGLAGRVTQHPWRFALLTLGLLSPFLFFTGSIRLSYDQMKDQPADTPALVGFDAMKRHFDEGGMMPVRLVLYSTGDFRQPEGLQTLETLAERLAALPGVSRVRTATRPLGDRMAEARPGNQLEKISDSVSGLTVGMKKLEENLANMAAGVRKMTEGVAASPVNGDTGQPAQVQMWYESLSKLAGGLDASAGAAGELGKGTLALEKAGQGYAALPESVFYLPQTVVQTQPDLSRAMNTYLSGDGHGAVLELILRIAPNGTAALDLIPDIRQTTAVVLRGTPMAEAEYGVSGSTSAFSEVRRLVDRDFRVVMLCVITGIFLVLALLLRSLAAPAYLIVTILMSFGLTMGISRLVFVTLLGGDGLHWSVPFFAFCVLVALGVDYNIFLMSRVREEFRKCGDTQTAVAAALASTGGIITSCGIIMAGTFSAMLVSPIRPIVQVGFAAVTGLLIDTFIIRTLAVPALAVLVGELNWWPGRRLHIRSSARNEKSDSGRY